MCEHMNFKAEVNVGRLSQEEGGPITHYCADIIVSCVECNQPFEFIGLPIGASGYHPTVSFDGTQLRAPIMPLGLKPPEGLIGFSITQSETEN